MTHHTTCFPSDILGSWYGVCDCHAWKWGTQWGDSYRQRCTDYRARRDVRWKAHQETLRSWHTPHHSDTRSLSYGGCHSNTWGNDISPNQTKWTLRILTIHISWNAPILHSIQDIPMTSKNESACTIVENEQSILGLDCQ